MQVTHIVFDLDGTLSDPADGIRNSLIYALDRLNVNINVVDVFGRFIGPPLQYGFSTVIGLDDQQTGQAVSYFREYYAAKGIFESTLYPGIRNLLSDLYERDARIYIATSKFEKYAREVLCFLDIESFFSGIAGADYGGKEATKEFLIRDCLKELSEKDRSGAVMVGDTKFDMEGARLNHIRSIGVLYGYGSKDELENAGAGFIAENVKQLAGLLL